MNRNTIAVTLALLVASVGTVGMAAGYHATTAGHDGGNCDQLDHADSVVSNASDEADDHNAVDRAQDECEGDHHRDEANQAADNADDNDESDDHRQD